MKKAIFPLSADPLTLGHIDLIARATKIFDQLVVLILENRGKCYQFDLTTRLKLAQKCLQQQEGIEIKSSSGLLVDFAIDNEIYTIVRGVRNSLDLEYEFFLESGYRSQTDRLEFCYLLADERYRTVKSSLVKSILIEGGRVVDYVPIPVKRKLEEKVLGQKKLLFTGGIASGKSYLMGQLKKFFRGKKTSLIHIDFDEIVSNLYQDFLAQKHLELQEKIKSHFSQVHNESGYVVKEKVSQFIFNSSTQEITNHLSFLEGILSPYIWSKYRSLISKREGTIFLDIPVILGNEGSNLDFLKEANDHVFLIDVDESVQVDRLVRYRGCSPAEAAKRVAFNSSVLKKKQLQEVIEKQGGKLIIYKNDQPVTASKLTEIYRQVNELFS